MSRPVSDTSARISSYFPRLKNEVTAKYTSLFPLTLLARSEQTLPGRLMVMQCAYGEEKSPHPYDAEPYHTEKSSAGSPLDSDRSICTGQS